MITNIAESRLRKPLCNLCAFLMLTLGVPSNLYAYDYNAPVEVKAEVKEPVKSRKLTMEEMGQLKGRAGNPYYAGQAKFDVVYKGVNLRTGNFSTSATDLSFEGGYGVPVNITRAYSVNNIDEGPFGYGWTLSADLRSTAGGLLKSSKAPVRSVPTGMKRRPSEETDPNIAAQPVEAVVITDADGKETTVSRDVDGILTTPPWDKNEYETEYEYIEYNGGVYWILKSNKTMTPDGTVYQYEKKGEYTNGSKPWDDAGATAEPNNVLKPVWVKDRHNNETTYSYGTTPVTFVKSNGNVSEKPLTGVSMPNGRSIELTWSGNRITQIRAYSTAEERKVLYGYTNGCLTSVQQVRKIGSGSNEYGRINRYGYSSNLLTSMTDPRGMTTSISYSDTVSAYGNTVSVDYVRASQISTSSGYETFHLYFDGLGTNTRVEGFNPSNTKLSETLVVTGSGSGGTIVTNVFGPGLMDIGGSGYWEQDPDRFNRTGERKVYSGITHDMTEQEHYLKGYQTLLLSHVRKETKYNFLGNTLWEKTSEYKDSQPYFYGISPYRETLTETAFWGEDKYFQQKLVRVTAGSIERHSFTDYYDSSAAQGKKGQTYRVYDNKHADFDTDTGITVPGYASSYAWKYNYLPDDLSKYSAQFDYDSKGRPVDVWKLQKVVSGTHNYVQTRSVYGSDGAPAYGNATEVTEDYGGASARTTQTLEFDLMGKAIETMDGANRVYTTTYDVDGNVLNVLQGSTTVVEYEYGTTDGTVENGQPTSIWDGLSDVAQGISYVQSGVAKGAPAQIVENAGGNQVTTTLYGYTASGDRETTTITTPNGTTRYKYSDYQTIGTLSPNRVFTRINKQAYVSSSWVNSAEEVRYRIYSNGQLRFADFAMTPQNSASNYDTYADPKSFVSAEYEYDGAGRTLSVKHYWNELNGSSYDREAIRGNSAAYAHDLGLKTSTSFLTRTTPGDDAWSTVRTENYGYDADFDYLTSVDYNDGLANEVQTWTYDAAGNRTYASNNTGTWTYDNLNRMTASPGATYDHDAVGNRTNKLTTSSGEAEYFWDQVNRLTGISSSISGWDSTYTYRADGMRVRKESGDGTTTILTRTYYDGQMPVEEDVDVTGTSNDKVTRNFVGARGLEMIETTASSSATVAYPLYDTHGNMIATVTKNSGGTAWNIGDERNYDVWGGVRQGAATGGPKGRYVANLGHVQDDESGLVYMRARYYEPASGRFVNEDPARSGRNWFNYAEANPVKYHDSKGETSVEASGFFILGFIASICGVFGSYVKFEAGMSRFVHNIVTGAAAFTAVLCFALALSYEQVAPAQVALMVGLMVGVGLNVAYLVSQSWDSMRAASKTIGSLAIGLCASYIGMVGGALVMALAGE